MASQGAAGWLGAVTGIGRRWATLMSRDSQLLRNAYRHLADEIDDPHLHVTKRGKKRFNPPTCTRATRGAYNLSRVLRSPRFITSSMSRRTTCLGSASDTARLPATGQVERGEYMITATPTRQMTAPVMSYLSGRKPSRAIPQAKDPATKIPP